MNTSALIPGSPHVHAGTSVPAVMQAVILALIPATLFGFYNFGWPALFLFMVTVGSCVLAEAFSLWLGGKGIGHTLADGSAILTGWLLAMSLPPWAPWWIGALGGVFAMVIGKHVFGGLGQNLFNPAMLARVMLLISFPLELTFWVAPAPMGSSGAPGFVESLSLIFNGIPDYDAISSATLLGHVRTEIGEGMAAVDALADYSPLNAALGLSSGSLAETSSLLILLGGLYLLARRVITWHIPVSMLLGLGVLAAVMHMVNPDRYIDAGVHLLSGGAMLGAFFIATDMVTSPTTARGQIVFGLGCGILVYVIRTWGGYPEGVAFAVLLMNALTPLIDHYLRPRIYGRNRRGEPQAAKSGGSQS